MKDGLLQVGLWASVALFVLSVLSTAMGWNAYRRRGGDAAGSGMAHGFHDLFRIALNVAAFVGAGCFALAHVFPAGPVHVLVSVLGLLLFPLTLVLFVSVWRW